MINLRNILIFVIFCSALAVYGQENAASQKSQTYKVLARLISFEGGDKVHLAKFYIIKNLSDSTILSGEITVGYYGYKQPDLSLNAALLTIQKYDGDAQIKNYFICPDYDGKLGIQKVKLEFIDADYWEGCETGKGHCKPLNFSRKKSETSWFLIMPCGGTYTTVTIAGENFNKEMNLTYEECTPYLDLSHMKDGVYKANMLACSLGGTVVFSLKTID